MMPDPGPPSAVLVRRLVSAALEEDGAREDVTTRILIPPKQPGKGRLVSRDKGIVCGLSLAKEAFAQLEASVRFTPLIADGTPCEPQQAIAEVEGRLAPILSAERVALNFVQRLSGIATATRRYVDAVADLGVGILDTRKTMPGQRVLERYAVRCGGGENHRFNLSDAVLIKDNHLEAARSLGLSLGDVIAHAQARAPKGMKLEIEVTTVEEARQALDAGAIRLLLDNMPLDEMRCVVGLARGRAVLEASGGVTLANVRAIAETGVDCISVGWITHSAPALDIALDVVAS
jgi:nicotinate-nucleotide pyrophosphorylase (carboxylating)